METKALVLFSICVHEELEVCIDQIKNLVKFQPNCIILIHVNLDCTFNKIELADRITAESLHNCYVNQNSLRLHWGCGKLLGAHLMNYEEAQHLNLSYDFFCLESSNSLLIKPGLDTYLQQYDCGFNIRNTLDVNKNEWTPPSDSAWNINGIFNEQLLKDSELINFAKSKGVPIHLGFHEGCFFSNEIARLFFTEMKLLYRIDNYYRYPTEETWIPTILSQLNRDNRLRVSNSYTKLGFPISIDDVAWLLKNSNNFFGVKQVPRKNDNPTREFIRSL